MALLKFNKGAVAGLANAPIAEGSVYITTDSQEMYVDVAGDKRVKISDFVTVAAPADLDTVAIYENAFYYVSETKTIVKYGGVDDNEKRIWEGINNTDQIVGINTRLLTAEGEIDALQEADNTLQENIDALNASNIDTTDEIVVTKAVGNYSVGKVIDPNTSVQDLLLNMLCSDSAPSVTNTSVSFTKGSTQYIEVGSATTLEVTATFEDGKYPYGYALLEDGSVDITDGSDKDKAEKVDNSSNAINHPGVTKTSFTINYDGGDAEADSVASDALTVTLNSGIQNSTTTKSATASVSHSAGYIPVSILKNKYKSKKIAANTRTASLECFRWYVPMYHGFKYAGATIADPANITASEVITLGNKITGETAYNMTKPDSAEATGSWMQYFVAIPSDEGFGATLPTIIDSNNLPLTVKEASDVSITLGEATKTYKVYYISLDAAYDTTKINLTW